MKMGLVGYSGSGKSTVFEWLTAEAPDPAKVQHGQTAMADVPDERLAKIAAEANPRHRFIVGFPCLKLISCRTRLRLRVPSPTKRRALIP